MLHVSYPLTQISFLCSVLQVSNEKLQQILQRDNKEAVEGDSKEADVYSSLFAVQCPIRKQFTYVYPVDNPEHHKGVYHTLQHAFPNLNAIQLFWEKGPVSHQIYQPSINNRTINWEAVTTEKKNDRSLTNVLANRSTSTIVSPFAFEPYSIHTLTPADKKEGNLPKVSAFGELLANQHKNYSTPYLDDTYAADVVYEEFQVLAALFNFEVNEGDYENDKLQCFFSFFVQLSDAAENIHMLEGFIKFIEKFQLHIKLEWPDDWKTGLTDENLPEALREFGFAFRTLTNIRLAVFDGQHRCHVISHLINGIYDFSGNTEPDFQTTIEESDLEANSWSDMSVFNHTASVVFGFPAQVKVGTNGEYLHDFLMPSYENKATLEQYGANINSGQNKSLDLSPFRKLMNEAMKVIERTGDFSMGYEDLFHAPFKGFNKCTEFMEGMAIIILNTLKSNGVMKDFASEYIKMNSKFKIVNMEKLVEHVKNAEQLLPAPKQIAKDLEAMMNLIKLALVGNPVTIKMVNRLFDCNTPMTIQVPTHYNDHFNKAPWIRAVFVEPLRRISLYVKKRIIFEMVILRALHQAGSSKQYNNEEFWEEVDRTLDMGTNFHKDFVDSFKVIKQNYKPRLLPELHPYEYLKGDGMVTSIANDKNNPAPSTVAKNMKWGTFAAIMERLIMQEIFNDMVDYLQHHGHNFVVNPVVNSDGSDSDSDPESTAKQVCFVYKYLQEPEKNSIFYKDDLVPGRHSFETFVALWMNHTIYSLDPCSNTDFFGVDLLHILPLVKYEGGDSTGVQTRKKGNNKKAKPNPKPPKPVHSMKKYFNFAMDQFTFKKGARTDGTPWLNMNKIERYKFSTYVNNYSEPGGYFTADQGMMLALGCMPQAERPTGFNEAFAYAFSVKDDGVEPDIQQDANINNTIEALRNAGQNNDQNADQNSEAAAPTANNPSPGKRLPKNQAGKPAKKKPRSATMPTVVEGNNWERPADKYKFTFLNDADKKPRGRNKQSAQIAGKLNETMKIMLDPKNTLFENTEMSKVLGPLIQFGGLRSVTFNGDIVKAHQKAKMGGINLNSDLPGFWRNIFMRAQREVLGAHGSTAPADRLVEMELDTANPYGLRPDDLKQAKRETGKHPGIKVEEGDYDYIEAMTDKEPKEKKTKANEDKEDMEEEVEEEDGEDDADADDNGADGGDDDDNNDNNDNNDGGSGQAGGGNGPNEDRGSEESSKNDGQDPPKTDSENSDTMENNSKNPNTAEDDYRIDLGSEYEWETDSSFSHFLANQVSLSSTSPTKDSINNSFETQETDIVDSDDESEDNQDKPYKESDGGLYIQGRYATYSIGKTLNYGTN